MLHDVNYQMFTCGIAYQMLVCVVANHMFSYETSEAIALDGGESCVTCVNGNHLYNEVSLYVISSCWSASVVTHLGW